MIKIDLQTMQDPVDIQKTYWLLGHDVLSDAARTALIEASQSHEVVALSLLWPPGDGTEFRCNGKVSSISPEIRVELIGKVNISAVPRARQ